MSQLDGTIKTVGTSIKVFGGLLVGLGLGAIADDFIEVNKQFDSLQASLVTVTGSRQEAAALFKDIQEFASTTPYQLAEVTEGFIKMKALGLDASKESIRSYGNTASAMSKSLNQMIEAVADAATGEFERLKEFGIKASSQGEKVKFTFQGVTTTVEKNANDIVSYLQKIGNEKFGDAMDRQMEGLPGKISNLSDTWDGLIKKLGDAGAKNTVIWAIDGTTSALDSLGKTIDELADKESKFQKVMGFLDRGAKQASYYIEQMVSVMNQLSPSGSLKVLLDAAENLGLGGTENQAGQRFQMPDRPSPSSGTTSSGSSRSGSSITRAIDKLDTDKLRLQWLKDETAELEANTLSADDAMAELYVTLGLLGTPLEQLTEGLNLYDETLQTTEEHQLTWNEGLKNSLDDLAKYYEESFGDRISASVNDAFSSMEDAFVEFAMTGKISIKDMVNSILADILRLTFQQNVSSPLASALASGIGNLFSGTSSGGGAVLNTDLASSGSFNLGGSYHNGGRVRVIPKFHSGGLASDELLAKLQTGETVLDREHTKKFDNIAAALQAGGGGGNVNMTMNLDLRGADETSIPRLQAASEAIANRAAQKVIDSMKRGKAAYHYSRG